MLLEKITREMVQIIQKRQEHFLFQSSPDTDTDTETVHIQTYNMLYNAKVHTYIFIGGSTKSSEDI